jgi:hypothetical protein
MSFETIRTIGWRAVEVALIVVLFCVLANIILGEHSGSFVESVAVNALGLARDIPPGTLIGLALIALIYAWFKGIRRA